MHGLFNEVEFYFVDDNLDLIALGLARNQCFSSSSTFSITPSASKDQSKSDRELFIFVAG